MQLPKLKREAAAQLIDSLDHTTETVPLSERRGAVTMGLLWITMVTGFPTVLAGFEWFKAGLTLPQVILCAALSCAIVMLYAVPAALLGAKSGLTYALLTRNTFGSWGSRLVSLNFLWIAMAWYALAADFLAVGLKGLFHFDFPTWAMGAVFAILMAFNNFFGFSGIANFARYIAGPVLILWVGYTFFKAAGSCPPSLWQVPAQHDFPTALALVSTFVIGYAVWGNEADFWRYGKPKVALAAIPMAVSLCLGQVVFPVTGWLMAYMFRVTEVGAATDLMNQYAFGGMSVLAGTALAVSYFAMNDSGLYGQINAVENLKQLPRKYVVAAVAVVTAVIAACIADRSNAFQAIASLSCVFLPCAAVIVMTEVLFLNKIFKVKQAITVVPKFADLPAVKWPALGALLSGYAAGLFTSGMVPGTAALHVGVPALLAWLTCALVFAIARGAQLAREAHAMPAADAQEAQPAVCIAQSESETTRSSAGKE
jgi:cytosine permease